MQKIFAIQPHTQVDKKFSIEGPIELIIDYDDVSHDEVDKLTVKVARILNAHWNDVEWLEYK
jgi:hypothetical protein